MRVMAAAFGIVAAVATVAILIAICSIESLNNELMTTRKHVTFLEQKVRLMEGDIERHDEIMVTYQFFNEHWTKEMKGE